MTRPLEPTSDTVNVNFRMSERDRRDLKIGCVENNLTMTEALVAGVALLRETRALIGPEPVRALLDVIRSASAFLVDQDSDLRVERRGPYPHVRTGSRTEGAGISGDSAGESRGQD